VDPPPAPPARGRGVPIKRIEGQGTPLEPRQGTAPPAPPLQVRRPTALHRREGRRTPDPSRTREGRKREERRPGDTIETPAGVYSRISLVSGELLTTVGLLGGEGLEDGGGNFAEGCGFFGVGGGFEEGVAGVYAFADVDVHGDAAQEG
jgi:hypothetical protein